MQCDMQAFARTVRRQHESHRCTHTHKRHLHLSISSLFLSSKSAARRRSSSAARCAAARCAASRCSRSRRLRRTYVSLRDCVCMCVRERVWCTAIHARSQISAHTADAERAGHTCRLSHILMLKTAFIVRDRRHCVTCAWRCVCMCVCVVCVCVFCVVVLWVCVCCVFF